MQQFLDKMTEPQLSMFHDLSIEHQNYIAGINESISCVQKNTTIGEHPYTSNVDKNYQFIIDDLINFRDNSIQYFYDIDIKGA